MVEVESRADVAAGQHDFRSQVAAVILGGGGGEGSTEPSGQMSMSYFFGPLNVKCGESEEVLM